MATDFHDVQFPADLTDGRGGYSFRGGPMFNTSILLTASGKEQRNMNWMRSICKYNVGHILKDEAGKAQLIAFFNARAGMRYGFRFKDWLDYTVSGTPGGSSLGILYSETGFNPYRLAKVYLDSEGYPHIRIISKPCSGLVADATGHIPPVPQLYINGSSTGAYSLDINSGSVVLASDPGWAAVTSGSGLVTWSGEFDVPVRFSTDVQQLLLEEFDDTDWPTIELTEIKLNLTDPTPPAVPLPPTGGGTTGGLGSWIGVAGSLTTVAGPALQFSSTSLNFVTGPLSSGDFQNGATFAAGGSATFYSSTGATLFTGSFRAGATWTDSTSVSGANTYTFSAVLSDGSELTLIANTGRSLYAGQTNTEAPTLGGVGSGGTGGDIKAITGPALSFVGPTLQFTTGLLLSGDLQNGAVLASGGSVTTYDSGGNVTFTGTFGSNVNWTVSTQADGTHVYTLTASLSDSRVVTVTANTGRSLFGGESLTETPIIT